MLIQSIRHVNTWTTEHRKPRENHLLCYPKTPFYTRKQNQPNDKIKIINIEWKQHRTTFSTWKNKGKESTYRRKTSIQFLPHAVNRKNGWRRRPNPTLLFIKGKQTRLTLKKTEKQSGIKTIFLIFCFVVCLCLECFPLPRSANLGVFYGLHCFKLFIFTVPFHSKTLILFAF